MINNPVMYKSFKDFTDPRSETNRAVGLSYRTYPNFLKYWDHRKELTAIWKTKLLETHIAEFRQHV